MPFQRRRPYSMRARGRAPTRFRRYRRTRATSGYVRGASTFMRTLWSDVKHLKRLVNTEVKLEDDTDSYSVSNPAAALPFEMIYSIAQGDGISQRNGNSLKVLGTRSRCRFINSGTEKITCRCIMLINWSTEGAVPTLGDVLQDPTNVQSPLLPNKSRDYRIIADRTVTLDPLSRSLVNFTVNRVLGHKFKYSGSGSIVSDTIGGQIFVCVFDNAATNHSVFDAYHRLRYVDN